MPSRAPESAIIASILSMLRRKKSRRPNVPDTLFTSAATLSISLHRSRRKAENFAWQAAKHGSND